MLHQAFVAITWLNNGYDNSSLQSVMMKFTSCFFYSLFPFIEKTNDFTCTAWKRFKKKIKLYKIQFWFYESFKWSYLLMGNLKKKKKQKFSMQNWPMLNVYNELCFSGGRDIMTGIWNDKLWLVITNHFR